MTRSRNGLLYKRIFPAGMTVLALFFFICLSNDAAGYPDEDKLRSMIPEKDIPFSCLGCHETSYELEGAEKIEAGRLLFQEYACYACHAARGFEALPKFAPPLEDLDTKLLDKRWIASWLRGPQRMHPGTIMPDFGLSDEEIADLAAFLLSLESGRKYPKTDLSGASPDDGERVFAERGCIACHSVSKNEATFRRRIPNFSDVGIKLNPDWVRYELEIPRELNPDSRVPKLELSERETANVLAYLKTLRANAEIVDSDKPLPEGSVERGRRLVEHYGCYGCHKVEGFEGAAPPSAAVAETADRPLEEFSFGDSKVKRTKWEWIYNKIESPKIYETGGTRLKMPRYKFDEGEIEDLTFFYLSNSRFGFPEEYMAPAAERQRRGQAGEWIVTEYNCRGCHMLEEGAKPRIEKFIGLKSYVPPRLVGEGEKVQPQWAFEYLKKPVPLRSWLKIRMPQFFFTDEQVRRLIEYFSAKADSPNNARMPYVLPIRKDSIPQMEIDMGEYRVRFDKCMQCHPITLEKGLPAGVKLEDLSTNLMLAKERLRFEWIKDFLRDPDKYAGSGTRMPYIYYAPDDTPKVPDAEMWIDYVAKYLMIMEEAPAPLRPEAEPPREEIDWTLMEY